MKLSNLIEEFIKEMIADEDGAIVLKRNELAGRFNCVPSQINYVISTRFSPERGYIVESQRGGGGYIRITRVTPKSDNRMMHIVNAIGGSISFADAAAIIGNCYDYDLISEKEAKIMMAALSEKSLIVRRPLSDELRAVILKNMLITLA